MLGQRDNCPIVLYWRFQKHFQPIVVPGTLRHIHMINNGKLYNGPKVLTDEMHVKTNMFDLQIL